MSAPTLPLSRRPAAVLWDFDGTLVDTEPAWFAAETELCASYDVEWTSDDCLRQVGNNLVVTGRNLAERGVPGAPEKIVEELCRRVETSLREQVVWRPGAVEQLTTLRELGVPMALVTMSYRALVTPVLQQLPSGTFAAVVTGDEVSHGKPHPAPYLAAARALGVDPGDCLAVEDSGTGAASADAAGCTVLVVRHHVDVPTGERRVFADSLAELRLF